MHFGLSEELLQLMAFSWCTWQSLFILSLPSYLV